ncbi:MAG TPA: toll/interleukin-1 receptor domain-containing protein, partial [Aggregatilineales bacterium]|nr:toll/interleukin-1 receptor domain-containing protein [Aggregatilineales bacterium]
MTTAFISYKTEYRPFAQQVRDFLRGLGYQTWLDADNIRKGEYFRDEIQKGLEASQTVIGIVTPEAIQSREVLTEWDYAFSSKGKKRLLLLRYQEADLPYWLKGVQYIDFVADAKRGFE